MPNATKPQAITDLVVRVDIRTEDINQGVTNSTGHCPGAVAIGRTFEQTYGLAAKAIKVNHMNISFSINDFRYTIDTPKRFSGIVWGWDHGKGMNRCTFKLDFSLAKIRPTSKPHYTRLGKPSAGTKKTKRPGLYSDRSI